MNRIVRERFPVADLPETLREGLGQDGHVRVTIEFEPLATEKASEKRLMLEDLYAMARPTFHSLEEIADHIRSIRQEWD